MMWSTTVILLYQYDNLISMNLIHLILNQTENNMSKKIGNLCTKRSDQ